MPTTASAFDLLWSIGGPKRELKHQISKGVANLGAWFRARQKEKKAGGSGVLDPRDCALHATSSAEATWYLSLPLTNRQGLPAPGHQNGRATKRYPQIQPPTAVCWHATMKRPLGIEET